MRRFLLSTILIMFVNLAFAQLVMEGKPGSGIQFKNKDNSFYLKFRTRIQPRWEIEYVPDKNLLMNRAFVKRARLKFDGHFINSNLRYKIEYDVVGGYVRDAMIKYRMGNFDLWFGQGKLPGNRERVVSSGYLQLVDRSIYNKYFTLDRDVGIQLHHQFSIGNVVVRDQYAITSGDGILDNQMSKGFAFTGKLEVLPFGKFTGKGDYKLADLIREKTPKLAIAGYGSFNKSAYKDRGQIGINLNSNADLLVLGVDLLFKYRGYSFLFETGQRQVTSGSALVYNTSDVLIGTFYTGWGMNAQTGYVFKNMWEVSVRYANTTPDDNPINPEITDYTIGLSKYIVNHSFKIQADFTLRQIQHVSDQVIGRFQVEYQF